jgi:hypothetical protein
MHGLDREFRRIGLNLRFTGPSLDHTCRRHKTITLNWFLMAMLQFQPTIYTEQRECTRLKYACFVVVRNNRTGKAHLGKLYNYSRLGNYIELEASLDPGSDVNILIHKSPYLTNPVPIAAKVMWCKDKDSSDLFFRYGIGVKYSQDVNS